MDQTYDELEQVFISETFYKSEPIREKAVKSGGPVVQKVFIRFKKVLDENGLKVKPKSVKNKLSDRFRELQDFAKRMNLIFETDGDEDNDDDYEDEDDDLECNLDSNVVNNSRYNRKHLLSLANKLKKKSIANRLGHQYIPNKNRLKPNRGRQSATLSWSEKFGRLLAAKKLLYLPLLYRKYRSGPKMSREELDIEIDLYMAEVRKKNLKYKLGLKEINSDSNGNGIVKHLKFGGFGGPKTLALLKKRDKQKTASDVIPDRDALDMEIDDYMTNKGSDPMETKSESIVKDELDMDLERYMSDVKNKPNLHTRVQVNGF